jgi:hypothetical protein
MSAYRSNYRRVGRCAVNLIDALTTIRQQSNMSDREYDSLVESCVSRANGPVPSTTPTVCGAPAASWNAPKMGSWLTQHDLAKVLGIPPVNVRQWQIRGKLPTPDDHVNQRPVWSRKTVKRFCENLCQLASAGSTV